MGNYHTTVNFENQVFEHDFEKKEQVFCDIENLSEVKLPIKVPFKAKKYI